jgi:dephospho-CoA kinase
VSAIIGLTGGIGSGKSAVANAFNSLDITIVDADIEARHVVGKGSVALEKIVERHGPQILENGEINRKALRKLIFSDDDERRWLEELTHPLIRESIEAKLNACNDSYCLLVSPLLLETDQHKLCDRILVVDVPTKIQLKRAMQRDNSSKTDIEAIIATQLPRQVRLKKANDIIDNSGTLSQTKRHVSALHQKYLKMFSV